MMHASHIHVRTLNNPNQPVQVQAQVQVDPGTSGAGDESETTTDTSDYKSFASSSSSSSRTSSPASSTSTTIHTTQGPEYSLLSDRDCTQDRDFSDLGFGTPIVSPGSPHAQQPRRLSTSSSRDSSWRGQNQDQPLDSHLPTQVSALSPTTAARDHDRDLDDSTMSLSSRPIDTEFAAPNSPPIKNTTNTLPHSPADSAPTTSQSPPPPSMATYTMPAGPTTGAQPPGIASLFPSALGLMTGAASDWSAQQHQQQQQQPASSYYYPSQQQQLPILRPPKVYGPLGTYEQLLDNVLSAAWSVAASVWAMLKTAGSWVVTPVKNVGWYYAGMVADTAALYWRASPHLRVFVYAFGLITAIPLAIFAGYAAVTLGITLAVASGGTLLASGAALGGGMLVLGPILLFSLIGAGLITLAVSVLSGGWHALFGGGEPQPQMMMASGGGAYVLQQPQQQQQGQGLIGSILGWLAPSSAAPPVAGSGYYGADAGMLKQPPGTYAGAAGMQMPMQQQQEPNVLAR